MRAGAHALSLLAVPLNVHLLRALEQGPTPLVDLRCAVGSPPQTTMRGHLRALTELGILERRRLGAFPGAVEFELTRPGHDLLRLAVLVQAWLNSSPDHPQALGSVAARSTIKALVEGWTSTMIRALVARPLTLTELDRLIAALNYPSLERRLGALRIAGLIEVSPSEGRGTRYTVTPWLRRSVGPLVAAALWERERPGIVAPLGRIDVEATFLLAVPMLRLPDDVSGRCRLAVELSASGRADQAGAMVSVRDGQIVSCVSRLGGDAEAWVSGSSACWLRAAVLNESDHLEIGGDWQLAKSLLDQFHRALFDLDASLRP